MKHDEALRKIYDYIDGELSAVERTAFEVAMDENPSLRAEVDVEQQFHKMLLGKVSHPRMSDQARARLFVRIAQERTLSPAMESVTPIDTTRWRRFAVAATIVLGLGLGTTWLSGEFGRFGINWSVLAASHHHASVAETKVFPTSDFSAARSYLISNLGATADQVLPRTTPVGMQTLSASIEAWDNTRLAHLELRCEVNGSISMFVIPATSFRCTNEPTIQVGDRTYHTSQFGCCQALCWQENGDYYCALIGDCDVSGLMQIAERWQSACGGSNSGNGIEDVR